MPLDGLQLGHYRLVRMIGKGGMGEVYLAEDTRLPRQVAIKIVQTGVLAYLDPIAKENAARLFQREMRVIVTLDHPRILPLYDFGEEQLNRATLTYMVMPFRPEGSLTDWLQQRNALPSPSDVASIVVQAADALDHAHQHQIIHMDVKPSNFLIRNRQDPAACPDLLLTDFGVARFTSTISNTSQSVRGTPTYMAPEQWISQPVPATDQYALAVMIYELLAGHPPFEGPPMRLMYLHSTIPPAPPSTFNPHLPPTVDAVLLRALAKEPEERFPFTTAFAQALQSAMTHTKQPPLTLRADSSQYPAPSPRARTVDQSHTLVPPKTTTGRQRSFSGGAIVLLALVLLFIMGGSVGIIYYVRANTSSSIHAITNPPSTVPVSTVVTTPPQLDSLYTQVTNGSPVIDDSLSRQTANNWYVDSGSFWSCGFTNGAYHASVSQPNHITSCMAQNSNFHNFAFEVQMTFITGDAGGINFRSSSDLKTFYRFYLYSSGNYEFYVVYPDNQGHVTESRLIQGHVTINASQLNTLSAIARDSNIYLYINKQRVGHLNDNKLSSGEIGIFCTDVTNATEVAFSNARVWVL